jgi:hypothetical protein
VRRPDQLGSEGAGRPNREASGSRGAAHGGVRPATTPT